MVDQGHEKDVHQGDLWAWAVAFVVTIGEHVGIVLFAVLSAALSIYALTAGFAGLIWWQLAFLAVLIVLSLTVWGLLVKQLVFGFRSHEIRGLGSLVVATSGVGVGELGADVGAGLIGLWQTVPCWSALLAHGRVDDSMKVLAAMVGGLFVLLGGSSLGFRLWVRHRRSRNVGPGSLP